MTDEESTNEIYPKLSQEPAFFLLIIILAVFLGEIIIMISLPSLIPLYIINGSIIDALLLVIIVSPILYLFSFRPLQSHIKELNRMKEELERGEERYRSLVESSDDSIYLVNKDHRYIFMNMKHRSRMGLSEDESEDLLYGDLHSPEDTKEFEIIIDKVFETGNSIKHEHKSHRDNRYFLRTFSPVKDPIGVVEAVTVISKDVTILKAEMDKIG
jgi:PAS domain S-box-containing protein